MKVIVSVDEWYPVTVWEKPNEWHTETPVEVPDEIIEAYEAAKRAFNEAEAALDKYYPDSAPERLGNDDE